MADCIKSAKGSSFDAAALVRLLDRCDAWRRPERFEQALIACECDARGRTGFEHRAYPQRELLLRALAACRTVPSADIAAEAAARGVKGPAIGAALMAARVAAVRGALGASAAD